MVLASSHGVSKAPKEQLVQGLLRAQKSELDAASSSARGSAEVSVEGADQEDKNKKRRELMPCERTSSTQLDGRSSNCIRTI